MKGYAREPHELGRFRGVATDAMVARLALTDQESLFSLLISAVSVVGSIVVLGVGGLHVIGGSLSIGTLMVVMACLGFVYGPMTAIAYTTGSIQQALASARRVRETLALPIERDPPDASTPTRLAGAVRFDRVGFAYVPGDPTLTNISFEARPGELVAIVGCRAQKTTLVSLLTRLDDASSGAILLDGVDVRRYTRQGLREQVGIVLQDGLLLSGTIAQNIRYGRLDATDAEVVLAARLAGAHGFIDRLPQGYATEMAEAGAGLSGGERQRLSIARAFLKDAPILVLDEPTAALDAVSEAHVLDTIRALREGRTTFVIAHRLSTVREADSHPRDGPRTDCRAGHPRDAHGDEPALRGDVRAARPPGQRPPRVGRPAQAGRVNAGLTIRPARMSHEKGSRLGPYEIVAPLGAGGMGEVYRARDARWARRRDQGAARRVLRRSRAAAPLRAGGAGGCGLEPPQHPGHLRRRRARRRALHRHRAARRRDAPRARSHGGPLPLRKAHRLRACRSPAASPPRTRRASSTAISSPRTSSSRATAASRSSTSASRS